MKKTSFFLFWLIIFYQSFASGHWTKIDKSLSSNTTIKLLTSTETTSVIQFNVNAYSLHRVQTPEGLAYTVKIPDGTPLQIKGAPDLPKLSASLIIPKADKMGIEVQYSDYTEIHNVNIAPSKGVITRDIDPKTVAYTYDNTIYGQNKIFPQSISSLNEPYIMRNYRGVAVWVYPVRYNPQTKTLRIYKTIIVKVSPTGSPAQINVLKQTKGGHAITTEFENIYKHTFLNYNTFTTKYTPIEEGTPGRMLIISYNSFMADMQPFVDWKNQKGIFTEIVDVSTIGASAAAIKSYVQNYYDNHSDFCYLLLVGDAAQVPTSSTGAGDSDNDYGYLAGSDHRIDIFVGRFSAENTSQVTTQVDRTIYYERDVTALESWMQYGLCIASDQGPGDDNEYDSVHEDNIKADYLAYGYTDVATCYESTGETATDITTAINTHCGVISYTGHGDVTMWYSVDPSGYTNTHVDALTNENKLPFIFSVACVIGDFVSNTCFGEAWQRATNNGNPTGAIANIASTINQSWNSPMDAQDEMVDILVESYTNNIKRTFGGIVANGWGLMIDDYGTDGENMADTWTVFGDASVMIRTKQPQDMTITHASGINVGSTSFSVNCDEDGALVSITKDNVIYGTAYVNSGVANVTLSPSITGSGNILVTVTAYNKVTYQQLVPIVQSTNPPVCDFSGTPTTITAGESVQFTDLSTEYPTSWDWTFTGADQTSSTQMNPTITYSTPGTYDVSLTVANGQGSDTETKTAYITVNPITDPPVVDFVADNTTITVGQTVNFTDLSTNMPTSWDWTFSGGTPASSSQQNPTITYDVPGTYDVTLTASNSIGSGTETKTAYITVTPPDYCDASALYEWEYIDDVICGSINNTGTGWTAYSDFTAQSTAVAVGGAIDVTVNIGNAYSTDQLYAWVDWNIDGDFDDAGENVFNSSSNGQSSYTFTINIPSTASIGNTRLRIRLNDSGYGSNNTPCGTSDYGEVEDYILNVAYLTGFANNQITGFEIYPNPNNGQFLINLPGSQNPYLVQISDITGKIIWAKSISQNTISVNLTDMEKGIYFVKVQGDEITDIKKIVIQ